MTGVSSDIVKGLKVQTNLSYNSYAMLLNYCSCYELNVNCDIRAYLSFKFVYGISG